MFLRYVLACILLRGCPIFIIFLCVWFWAPLFFSRKWIRAGISPYYCFGLLHFMKINELEKATGEILKLELVYLPKGKYCVYPRMVYRQAMA